MYNEMYCGRNDKDLIWGIILGSVRSNKYLRQWSQCLLGVSLSLIGPYRLFKSYQSQLYTKPMHYL
jgi:hypothetical protein